jgi:Recombinase
MLEKGIVNHRAADWQLELLENEPGRCAAWVVTQSVHDTRSNPLKSRATSDGLIDLMRRYDIPITDRVKGCQNAGHTSCNAIAGQLNARKVTTARGERWTHVQVRQILDRGGTVLISPFRAGAVLRSVP